MNAAALKNRAFVTLTSRTSPEDCRTNSFLPAGGTLTSLMCFPFRPGSRSAEPSTDLKDRLLQDSPCTRGQCVGRWHLGDRGRHREPAGHILGTGLPGRSEERRVGKGERYGCRGS